MKILFVIKTVSVSFVRNSISNIAPLVLFLLYALPAFASQEVAASHNGSVLNILLLGCIAYFLVRSFRRRSGGDDNQRSDNEKRSDQDKGNGTKQAIRSIGKPRDKYEAARQTWSVLSSEKSQPVVIPTPVVSAGDFDEVEFLEGAKLFFTRFQQVRDSQDLQDLRGFLSDGVYLDAVAEVQRNPISGDTKILFLNVRFVDKKTEGGKTFTTVFYDAQISRGDLDEQPDHIRVVWEFSRDDTSPNALWVLEKINKVDQ